MVSPFVLNVIKPKYEALDTEHRFYARNFFKLYKQYPKIVAHTLSNPQFIKYLDNPSMLKRDYLKRIEDIERSGKRVLYSLLWQHSTSIFEDVKWD